MAGKHKQNVSRIKPNQISLNDSLLATNAHKKKKNKTGTQILLCYVLFSAFNLYLKKTKHHCLFCITNVCYLVLFCRLGVFFSPNPEQMNLELSSSTSPITTTATSPSRPSCQLTLLLLAVKNTNTLKHYKSTSYWNKTESAFEFPSVTLSKKKLWFKKNKQKHINVKVGYAYKSYKAISK